MYTSTGVLRYAFGGSFSLRLVVDPDIGRYYRSLIPRWVTVKVPAHPTHISVVRKEVPPATERWDAHEGEEVEFQYENVVRFGAVYVWLNAFCIRLEEVRTELGLPVHSPYTQPPEQFTHCFHITIANFKGV